MTLISQYVSQAYMSNVEDDLAILPGWPHFDRYGHVHLEKGEELPCNNPECKVIDNGGGRNIFPESSDDPLPPEGKRFPYP